MESILNIFLIIIAIAIVRENNNLKLVLYMCVFSLICASLYYMYKAPDVALAEAAIGSAIIPLIYIVAIARQNEFIVINQTEDGFLQMDSQNSKGEGNLILEEFCKNNGFKFILLNKVDASISGVFRERNVDLIVEKSTETEKYLFKGKKSNILINRLELFVKDKKNIQIVRIEEKEKND